MLDLQKLVGVIMIEGTYKIKLKNIQGGSKNFGEIEFGTLTVNNGDDITDPDVKLIYPDWEDEVDSEDIEFEFKVDEARGIENCSFKLYSAKEGSGGVYQTDELLFPLSSNDKKLAEMGDVKDDKKVELRLIEFDEGDYIWEVKCFDEAGNDDWDFNYFEVKFEDSVEKKENNKANNYSRQDEVAELIEKMNEFLEKEDDFGIEERRILDILGFFGKKGLCKWIRI